MGRDALVDDGSGPDDGHLADLDTLDHYAAGGHPDAHADFNGLDAARVFFPEGEGASRVGADNAPVTDLGVVLDGDEFWMDAVEDNVVSDVDVLPDVQPPHPVELHSPGGYREVGREALQAPVLEEPEAVSESTGLLELDRLVEGYLVTFRDHAVPPP